MSAVIVARLDSVIVVVLYLYTNTLWMWGLFSWTVHFSILCNLQNVKFDRQLNNHCIVDLSCHALYL